MPLSASVNSFGRMMHAGTSWENPETAGKSSAGIGVSVRVKARWPSVA
jgi:hypothetical protein